MLMALYNINVDELMGERARLLAQNRRRRIVGWTLASAAIVERLALIFAPSSGLFLVATTTWFFFVAFVTWIQLRSS